MAREVTSKHIEGITDLVVVAPIRDGFIDAYENVTFDTRVRIVAEAMHNLRVSAREYEPLMPFADTAERILDLLNYRIGILDRDLFQLEPNSGFKARRYVYLTVTFDGAWEPYMRLVWEPLGTFLDLIFCNCEGYKPARDSSYEDYIEWVRASQIDSAIFYSTTGLTVRDQIYLRNFERIQRERDPAAADLEIAGFTLPDPADDAKADLASDPVHAIELGLEALTVLYRLADYYPPDRLDPALRKPGEDIYAEGRYLLRAARDLLQNIPFQALLGDRYEKVHEAYADQLDWYYSDPKYLESQRPVVEDPLVDDTEIQAGILHGIGNSQRPVREGALLLMTVTDAEAARQFLKWLAPIVSYESEPADGPAEPAPQPPDSAGEPAPEPAADEPKLKPIEGMYCTIGLTMQGFTRLGLRDDKRDRFPKEFREGMAKRSGLIGDLRENHPRNWTLPERNWPLPSAPVAAPVKLLPPVEMDEIDFVIQLRYAPDPGATAAPPSAPPPLDRFGVPVPLGAELIERMTAIADLAATSGAVLAAFEPMASFVPPADGSKGPGEAFGHFPFRDGLSQPQVATGAKGARAAQPAPLELVPGSKYEKKYEQGVSRGELIVGFANDRGDQGWAKERRESHLHAQGSFLAVRKLEQNVQWFDAYFAQESARISTQYGIPFTVADLQAKLLGRKPDGTPLVTPASEDTNDFTYLADPPGHGCPLGSHIRRANPRDVFQGRRSPRMMRRGMSFGPQESSKPGKRGVMFMAYCSSLAEQYETIQRWLNGGNSGGQNAAQNDPLLGLHPAKGPQVYRFVHEGKVIRTTIAKPFVKLDWGLYLFVPSRWCLTYIWNQFKGGAPEIADPREARGRDMMNQINQLEPKLAFDQWKRILEDFDTKDPAERDLSPDVWSAIRYFQSGCYRIPNSSKLVESYVTGEPPAAEAGKVKDEKANAPAVVLVGSKTEAMAVLSDPDTFAVDLQAKRFTLTSGDIYVAMPRDKRYEEEATATNQIMLCYPESDAFDVAYKAASDLLTERIAIANANKRTAFKIELRRDFLAKTLALICKEWFGLPDGDVMEAGAWSWAAPDPNRTAICPGDFMAPSRDAFYPQPNHAAKIYALDHGPKIIAAGKAFVGKYPAPLKPPGYLSGLMADVIRGTAFTTSPGNKNKDDVLARNIIGMMIGMLPPIDGNVRGILYEWLTERTLWRHQAALLRSIGDGPVTFKAADVLRGPITRAMCKRPGPDLLYRRVTKDHLLKTGENEDVPLYENDIVIVSLVSVTQRSLWIRKPDVSMIFGGGRENAPAHANEAFHGCPAQKMMMATIIGIMAALLNVGRIKAMPSSLIVELSDWQ